MFEFLFEFIGELLLNLVVEALGEFGLHVLKAPFEREPRPVLAGLGWLLFGALAGGLSLLVLPHNVLQGGWRIANLVCVPLAVAAVAWTVDRLRQRDSLVLPTGAVVAAAASRHRAAYAGLFALAMASVRFAAG